jgi:hypothetical protein
MGYTTYIPSSRHDLCNLYLATLCTHLFGLYIDDLILNWSVPGPLFVANCGSDST